MVDVLELHEPGDAFRRIEDRLGGAELEGSRTNARPLFQAIGSRVPEPAVSR